MDRRANSTWTAVYHEVRNAIAGGHYAPGEPLPTLRELAADRELTIHGARRVMERLRSEGRVQGWQGKGYCVAMPLLNIALKRDPPAFGSQVRGHGRRSASELVATSRTGLPSALAPLMRHRSGTRVVRTETLRKADGIVVALSVDYFPADRLGGIADVVAQTGSVTEALAAHGVLRFRRDETTIMSRLPTAHEALMLDIPRQQPVYATLGANLDPEGRVVEVSTGIWRADCVRFLC